MITKSQQKTEKERYKKRLFILSMIQPRFVLIRLTYLDYSGLLAPISSFASISA